MDQAVTQQDLTAKIPERDGPSSDTTGPYSQDTSSDLGSVTEPRALKSSVAGGRGDSVEAMGLLCLT